MKAIGELLRKDPFGTAWVTLMFLAALIVKWWFIQPEYVEAGNSVALVVVVAMFIAILATLLASAFWIFWSDRAETGMGFYFALGAVGIVCSIIVNKFSDIIVGKMYYGGYLNWQEAESSVLLDQFVPHFAGLYLASFMLYLSIRMLFVMKAENRLPMIATSLALVGVSAFLLLLGIKLY